MILCGPGSLSVSSPSYQEFLFHLFHSPCELQKWNLITQCELTICEGTVTFVLDSVIVWMAMEDIWNCLRTMAGIKGMLWNMEHCLRNPGHPWGEHSQSLHTRRDMKCPRPLKGFRARPSCENFISEPNPNKCLSRRAALGQEMCHTAPQLKVQGVKFVLLEFTSMCLKSSSEREGWEMEEAVALLEFQAQFLVSSAVIFGRFRVEIGPVECVITLPVSNSWKSV